MADSVQAKDSSSSSQGESAGGGSLFKEVVEKKQNLRRIASEVGVMAAELHKFRSRGVAREAALQEETARRQAAEAYAKELARELEQMHKCLEDTRSQAESSAERFEQYAGEVAKLRDRLSVSEEVAEAISEYSESAQQQLKELLNEVEEKDLLLREQRDLIAILEEHVRELEEELQRKEESHMHLKYDVHDLDSPIQKSVDGNITTKQSQFRQLLDQVSSRNIDHLERYLSDKDDDVVRLKQDVREANTELRLKTLELNSQMERQERAEQELRKRLVRLELSLQEARSQAKKMKKISGRKEKEMEQLRSQVWLLEGSANASKERHFWDHLRLRTVLSVSLVAMICLLKR
ncbi:hypothetical protein R1flu_016404 [Riccia fluitans]|uniref:Uncharacterized protein n=1 Tax=Riccia fluitans TaxID=41844 RepID=A0ABD1YMB3_9MARC